MNFEKVMERMAVILEQQGNSKVYDKDIASALGMTSTQYSNAKSRNSIPYERIAAFCGRRKISINWILFDQSISMLTDEHEDIYRVKLLNNINASAGGGAFNEDYEDFTYIMIDPLYRDLLGIGKNDTIEAIRVVGDSMENTLNENSIVLVDRRQTELVDGNIFVVNTPGGVFIKRIAKNPSGGINLISDNRNYETTTVAPEDLRVIGRVIGALEKM